MEGGIIPRVAILGHSFIRRLNGDIQDSNKPEFVHNFDLKQCIVKSCGVSSATINKLKGNHDVDSFLLEFQPHILIVQLGENDLCDENLRPETAADKIFGYIKEIKQTFGIITAIICELFPRKKPLGTSVKTYHDKLNITNKMLDAFCDVEYGINYWKHLRLCRSQQEIFIEDGVHMNELGQRKFYRSVRLCIMRNTKYVFIC